jgi:excinuclease UvrABC helicase subunit UvrB
MLFSMGVGKKIIGMGDKNDEVMDVPDSILHPMIQKAYDFYQEIDKIEDNVNPKIKEQIEFQLGDIKYNDFIESSIESYKNSLFELVNNYNSNKEEYNKIKIELFQYKMKEAVEIEDYEFAAKIRDKIKELKDKI